MLTRQRDWTKKIILQCLCALINIHELSILYIVTSWPVRLLPLKSKTHSSHTARLRFCWEDIQLCQGSSGHRSSAFSVFYNKNCLYYFLLFKCGHTSCSCTSHNIKYVAHGLEALCANMWKSLLLQQSLRRSLKDEKYLCSPSVWYGQFCRVFLKACVDPKTRWHIFTL